MAQTKQAILEGRLPNGLRLIVAPMPVRSVTVAVFVRAGSRYETPEINGASHFLEHLCFDGTSKRPTSREIAEVTDSVGGRINAYTGQDRTCYHAKVPRAYLEQAMDVISDIVSDPLLTDEHLERERGVITEEIKLYNDDPNRQIHELLPPLLWPGQPLGMTIAGPVEVIERLTREEIQAYRARHYLAENMVVVVAGGIDPEAVTILAERYFHSFGPGERIEPPRAKDEPGIRVKGVRREIDQTHLVLSYYAPSLTDPDRYAVRLLNVALGEGMSSRLFQEVREKRRLAYNVYSMYEPEFDTGSLTLGASVNSEKVEEAVQAAREVAEAFATAPIPAEELKKARAYAKGSLELRLEDSGALSDWLGNQIAVEGVVRAPEEFLAAYDRVTVGDIERVARRIFDPASRVLAMVGPRVDEDELPGLLQ